MTAGAGPGAGSADPDRPVHDVQVRHREGVTHLLLDRPQARNALSLEMRHGVTAGLEQARQAGSRVVVIGSANDHFCAGGDIADMVELGDVEEARERVGSAAAMILSIVEAPMAVVAVAPGAVAGIGLSLFMATDLRLVAESTRLFPAFPSLGLIPDGGLTHLLPAAIGDAAARRWLLTNRSLTGAEAATIGLCAAPVPDPELEAAARQLVDRLLRLPAGALAETKRALNRERLPALRAALEHETATQARLLVSEPTRALMRSFLDRG